ncbi:MAG: hypothetical protein FJZ00_00515 [Candidatus Sericytochromatia bacterium]|uniref:Uncharacterized protein n=1 Tax=Candidatus Tanganyikabacteria bacterium TaxID=2961651 RepID=A0A938BLU2_9BACT|nr:hypothetical protein [Candidatus Tanganyikabacteria bacterium]
MVPRSQRITERRSLEYKRRIAQRVLQEPELLDLARTRVAEWLATRGSSRPYLERWKAALDLPLEEVLALLVEDSERGRELRGASPFAGCLPPRERWRIWRAVRAELDAAEP